MAAFPFMVAIGFRTGNIKKELRIITEKEVDFS